jgi:hypothetical protein
VFWRNWIIIDQDFFGNVMSIRRSIGWPNGAFFINLRVGVGMSIIDLDIQNKCLLSRWIIKLINEDGLWQRVLKKKYLKGKTLSQVERKQGDSHFWSGLMEIKKLVLVRDRFQVHDGS